MDNQNPNTLQPIYPVQSASEYRSFPETPSRRPTPDTTMSEDAELPTFRSIEEIQVYIRGQLEAKEQELHAAKQALEAEKIRNAQQAEATRRLEVRQGKQSENPFRETGSVGSSRERSDPPRFNISSPDETVYPKDKYRYPKLAPPSRFDGGSRNTVVVSRWLFEAKRYCSGSNFDPRTWTKVASSYLTDFAQTWFVGRTDLHDTTWDNFEGAMHTEYDDELSQTKLLDLYHSISQEQAAGRSITVYNDQFRRLANEIPETLVPANLRLYHYYQGLMLRTRQDVERTNPRNLQEAMRAAAQIENIQRSAVSVPSFSAYMSSQASHARQALSQSYGSYGDPMDLSNIEEALDEIPEQIDDLWALEEQDPERFYETIESLHAINSFRGRDRFRGRMRGRGTVRGRGSFRSSYGKGKESEEGRSKSPLAEASQVKCYSCGKPGHKSFECPQRATTKKTVNQVTEEEEDQGKESGRD
jgi:hypothetical protein